MLTDAFAAGMSPLVVPQTWIENSSLSSSNVGLKYEPGFGR